MTTPAGVLRAADHVRMPWANGGGTTYQVATWPAGSTLDTFDWRVSLADIDEGGPFSAFPGVDRILVLVEGPGMELAIDDRVVPLAPREPVRFDGSAVTSCVLTHGPTRDLNVMTRRGRCTATLDVVDVADRLEVAPDHGWTVLVVVLGGEVEVGGAVAQRLGPRDALVADRGLELAGPGALALIRIRPA